ncbi:MAG: T9SS type A sorting domain-containing protein [Sporocytophaga sp.]|uniref:T9SS type A sorting domain-containing protein n=1 Tax=Sporocytophaga sp. TaxID=2231183 RepID=UPI001B0EA118|nr:T9SS type A sorting domain-containing protein [Sporocytophaga sp.]MBO9700351.1 T9SS type A sorting domain-containing protein [Sporocytophaga sp.]
MKRLFIVFTAFLGTYVAQAQPEFNSIITPKDGQIFKSYTLEDVTVSPGNGGANQYWDFSEITFPEESAGIQTYFFANPSNASAFPTANFIENSDEITTYYNYTSTEEVELGYYDSAEDAFPSTMVYSDPKTTFKAPFAYNETQTDDYYGSITIGEYSYIESGSNTNTYDGYGTLKTSFGTFNNVIRIKISGISNYEIQGFGTHSTTIDAYGYFIPGYTLPLFGIVEATVNGPEGETSFSAITAYDPASLTSNKNAYLQNLKLSVSPNPASDIISVDFKDLASDNYILKITEQSGAIVKENSIYAAKGESHNIDISDLKNGLYFLEVSSDKGKAVKKIVKL